MIVKIVAYSGTVAAPVSNRVTDENLQLLKQPCLGHQAIQVSGDAVTSAPTPKDTALVEIQVQDGQTICYEMNAEGQSKVATQDSPWLTGNTVLHCGPNWTISVVM